MLMRTRVSMSQPVMGPTSRKPSRDAAVGFRSVPFVTVDIPIRHVKTSTLERREMGGGPVLVEDRRTDADWRMGFRSLEAEIGDGVELSVEGTLPSELEGTLYRIGPARHDVYGERYRHWFDGDGMVHAVRLSGGKAEYRNRFVATAKKREEDAAQRRLYPGFGTPPAGGVFGRMRRARGKSAANTNIVFHGGKLLALWEAGRPWGVDPTTLETIGEDDMGGVLGPHQAMSAHPKLDRATGDMWNFGVGYGPRNSISLYRTTPEGVTERVAKVPLSFGPMVHDFALTAT